MFDGVLYCHGSSVHISIGLVEGFIGHKTLHFMNVYNSPTSKHEAPVAFYTC